jgi:hypothetical protein
VSPSTAPGSSTRTDPPGEHDGPHIYRYRLESPQGVSPRK